MDPWLIGTFASGFAVALLGLFLLAADARRDWNRVFALFAIFWGLQIVAANLVRVLADPAMARPFGVLALALVIPLYFFVTVFASIYPRPRGPFGTSSWALVVLVLPALAALLLLLFAPRLLLQDVVALPEGGSTMQWGPLFAPLVLAPLYGGFFYALFVMMRRFETAERVIERRQVVLVLAALGVFVAYNVPLQLILFGTATVGAAARSEAASQEAALIGVVMFIGLVLLVVLGRRLAGAAVGASSRTAEREVRAVGLALAAAALLGILEGVVATTGGPRLQMVGLVRAATVALVAYGIARYQLFDLDLRVKAATRVFTVLLVLVVVGIAGWTLAAQLRLPPITRPIIALLVVLLAAVPFAWTVRRLVERFAPHVSHRGDHLYLRKLEVYQAALWDGKEDGLADLRRRLGLGEADHEIAVRLASARRGALELVPGALAFDRYLVEAVIGEGTYGRVFVARDLQVGRHVAIKELEAHWAGHPGVRARFLREARLMGRLAHPRIVSLYEVERRGADQYLILEHIGGGSLAERLTTGRLARGDALRVLRDVLEGLAVAHARGVVHRDLKPANVLLDQEGRAKLADFGVAGALPAPLEETLVGLPEPVEEGPVGSLLYMAPELARGAPATACSDLYAAGAVYHQMRLGRPHRSLEGLGVHAAFLKVAEDGLPDLDVLEGSERVLLERMLEPDPGRRAADATELIALVDSLAAPIPATGSAGVATPGGPSTQGTY